MKLAQTYKFILFSITFLLCVNYTIVAFAASDVEFGLVDLGEGDTFYRIGIDVDTYNSTVTGEVIFVFDEGAVSEHVVRTQLLDGKVSRITDYPFVGERKFPETITVVIGSNYYVQKESVQSYIGDLYTLRAVNSKPYDNKFEVTGQVVTPSNQTQSPNPTQEVSTSDKTSDKKQGIVLDDSGDKKTRQVIACGLAVVTLTTIYLLYRRSKKW